MAIKENRQYLTLAAVVLLCLGGGWFLYRSGFFAAAASPEHLRAFIQRYAPYSQLIFFAVQFFSVVLAPIPSNISATAGGMLFGTWQSFFITFCAVMSGSLLVFWLARVLGRSFADRIVSRRLSEKYQQAIRARTSTFLALAFLFPYFPDDVLCILAGLSTIPFRRFLLIALVTRPWGLLFASALGGTTLHVPVAGLVLIGVGGLLLFLLGLYYGPRLESAILCRFRHN